MRTLLAAAVAILLPIVSPGAQEIHSKLCLHGCPSGSPPTNDLIIREIYVLSSNDTTRFADWVAYRISADTIGPSRQRRWKADPLLAEDETLEPDDYTDAHAILETDRGHQTPLASFSGTPFWKETNYLSNITPQKSDLNQGAWRLLEGVVRDLIDAPDIQFVYVMTGPLYEKNMPPLPQADEAHLVPSGYWKIIAVEGSGDIRLAAFLFDQETSRNADFCDHVTTVREIEIRSGLDFFHALKPAVQEGLDTGAATLAAGLGCGS